MLPLALCSCLLEIANDAFILPTRILIGCSLLSQEYCKLIGWLLKSVRRQLCTLTCLIYSQQRYCPMISFVTIHFDIGHGPNSTLPYTMMMHIKRFHEYWRAINDLFNLITEESIMSTPMIFFSAKASGFLPTAVILFSKKSFANIFHQSIFFLLAWFQSSLLSQSAKHALHSCFCFSLLLACRSESSKSNYCSSFSSQISMI